MYREYYADHPGEFEIDYWSGWSQILFILSMSVHGPNKFAKNLNLGHNCSMVWGSDQSIGPNFGDATSGNHLRPRSGISSSAAVNNGTELPEEKNDSHELRPIRPMDYSVYYFSLVLAWKLPYRLTSRKSFFGRVPQFQKALVSYVVKQPNERLRV